MEIQCILNSGGSTYQTRIYTRYLQDAESTFLQAVDFVRYLLTFSNTIKSIKWAINTRQDCISALWQVKAPRQNIFLFTSGQTHTHTHTPLRSNLALSSPAALELRRLTVVPPAVIECWTVLAATETRRCVHFSEVCLHPLRWESGEINYR